MKKIVGIILLSMSLFASLLNAKEVELKTAVIKGFTAQALRNHIENLERGGNTIKATDEQKNIIKNTLKFSDDQVNSLLNPNLPPAQQPAYAGPGTGGTGTGTGSGSETGGTGTGATGGMPSAPSAPSAPAAPAAPIAPSAPGVPTAPTMPSISSDSSTQQPTIPTKKPVEDLTPEQLAALPDSAKTESDAVINAAINQIAQLALSEKYISEMNRILQDALKKPAFKNKQLLRASLAKEGSFGSFVASLKDAQLSGELYDDLTNPASSNLIKMLMNVFQSYRLKPQTLNSGDAGTLLEIILNMALGQRPIIAKPAEGAQIISDSQATNMLDGLITLIKADPGFTQFIKDSALAASKPVEKGQKDEPVVALLEQDFLTLFLQDLRLLLIHPKFLKIADKEGKLGGKGTILAADGLLNSLKSEDPNAFNVRRIRGALVDQAYYDPTRFEEFIKENEHENALKALLSDHANRLKSIVYPVQDFLNKELATIKTIKDLKNKLQFAAARAKFKNDADKKLANDMIQNIDVKPDSKVIGDGLKALGVDLSLISEIKKMIVAESKKFEVEAKVKAILEQIKEAAKKGAIDSQLVDQLKALLNPYQMASLAGVERTVDSAYGVLIALIGKAPLTKIVPLKEFYNWIYEYGLLMLLFKSLQTEAKGVKPQDILERLKASLMAMDAGDIKSNVTYFSIITDPRYRHIIEDGLYKGKLNTIIENITNYDLGALRNALKAFVAQAHIGVEDSTEFVALVDAAFDLIKKAMLDELIRQLQVLNSGSGGYPIKGLELTGTNAGRNALIYDALKAVFKNEENALRAGLDKLDIEAFKRNIPTLLAAIKEKLNNTKDRDLKKLTDDQKKVIIDLWQNYLNNVADKLDRLKKAAQPAYAHATAGEPTAPTTPSAPEAPSAPSAPTAPAYGEPSAPTAPSAPEAPAAPPM